MCYMDSQHPDISDLLSCSSRDRIGALSADGDELKEPPSAVCHFHFDEALLITGVLARAWYSCNDARSCCESTGWRSGRHHCIYCDGIFGMTHLF